MVDSNMVVQWALVNLDDEAIVLELDRGQDAAKPREGGADRFGIIIDHDGGSIDAAEA